MWLESQKDRVDECDGDGRWEGGPEVRTALGCRRRVQESESRECPDAGGDVRKGTSTNQRSVWGVEREEKTRRDPQMGTRRLHGHLPSCSSGRRCRVPVSPSSPVRVGVGSSHRL